MPRKPRSPSTAQSVTDLQKTLTAVEKEARAAKDALKIAKQRAKATKRDLKTARKALKHAIEKTHELSKTDISKTDNGRTRPSPTQRPTSGKAKNNGKGADKSSRKRAATQELRKPREIGSRVANSPETRRRPRVKKPRKVAMPGSEAITTLLVVPGKEKPEEST